MKVALETSNLARAHPTGVASYGVNLINQLARLDQENTYVLCYRLSRLKYRPHFFRVAQPNFHVKILQEPLHFLFMNRIDLYHGLDARVYESGKARKVVTIHDLIQFVDGFPASRRNEKIRRHRRLMSLTEGIITNSEYTKKDVLKHFPVSEEKIKVIHLGVGEFFRPQAPERVQEVVERHRIRIPYFLFVGCIERRKNLVRLLEAFVHLKKQLGAPVQLVLAGGRGAGSEEVLQAIARLQLSGEVLPLGYVPQEDLPALYTGASIFLFPSLYEGFGLPVLEAMACGTPVITSNVTSLPEVAGEAALLVDPASAEEMAGAMIDLFTKSALREMHIFRGFERVKQFTWERTARATLSFYQEVLDR